jgi:predicted DNA-binding protein YlxM (UPF0122 family)
LLENVWPLANFWKYVITTRKKEYFSKHIYRRNELKLIIKEFGIQKHSISIIGDDSYQKCLDIITLYTGDLMSCGNKTIITTNLEILLEDVKCVGLEISCTINKMRSIIGCEDVYSAL